MQIFNDFFLSVFNFINSFIPNYGIDIILFTVFLKIILLPFTYLQTKSTIKTQIVQPKLKQIQEKYKNDPKKLQQAQMEIYKKEGFNPLSGCLLLLIQWPILISVFYVFRSYAFGDAIFLGLNLGKNLKEAGVELPLIGNGLGYLFAAFSGLTTYISTLLLTPKNTGAENNPMMSKNTNIFMSIFFVWITLTVTAGLAIYWIVNNILQMGTQYILNKIMYKKYSKE